jgi:hypothetical protein
MDWKRILKSYLWIIIFVVLVAVFAFWYSCIVCHWPWLPPHQQYCSFSTPRFSCYVYKLTANTSNQSGLILDLFQTTEGDIKIIGVNCTTSKNIIVHDFEETEKFTIPTRHHRVLRGTYANPLPIPCWKEDGTTISPEDAGSQYRGKIYIHYVDLKTNTTNFLTGDILSKVGR